VNLVGEVFDTSEEEIKRKGSRSAARKAAIYLMQRYSGLSISEIGELFGGIHFSAVSKISSRLKGEMAADKRLFRKVEQVESKIKA
jgi:chromosomal replication initiation ATPase DnaA